MCELIYQHATRWLPALACGSSDAGFSVPGMDPLVIKGDACSSPNDETATSELKEDVKMVRMVKKNKINVNTQTVHMHKVVLPECSMSLLQIQDGL